MCYYNRQFKWYKYCSNFVKIIHIIEYLCLMGKDVFTKKIVKLNYGPLRAMNAILKYVFSVPK